MVQAHLLEMRFDHLRNIRDPVLSSFFSFLLGTFSVLDDFIRVYQHMVHGKLHAYALSVTVLDHYARITLDSTRGKSTQTKLFTTTFFLYETNLFLYKRHYRLLLQIF